MRRRSLPLLGRTVDTDRLADVLSILERLLQSSASRAAKWQIIGRGQAGLIGAYAALLEPRIAGVTLIDPPPSHRDGPIFLNFLRVLDIPEALGLLAPQPLTIYASQPSAFNRTAALYRVAGGTLKLQSSP